MESEAGVLQDRIEIATLEWRVGDAQKGFEVVRMKSSKAAAIHACTASAFAFSLTGKLLPKAATSAPNSARIEIHSIMEPSWFPQTLIRRYINGIVEFEFS